MEQPSSSSNSSPSSSSLDSRDEQILSLSRRLDHLERLLKERANLDDDPAITTQAPLQLYHPTDDEIAGCPNIKPNKPVEFFTKTLVNEYELKEAIRGFPKNVFMDQYKAPKVPQIVPSSLTFDTSHDLQIREFQERCADLTRPVDFYYHEFKKLQEVDPALLKPSEILDLSVSFAVLMRQHLGGMAVKMHETRMSNVRMAAGAGYKDTTLHMSGRRSFHDHTKSVRAVQALIKNKKGSDNRRDKGGFGNNNNIGQGNSPGYNSRYNSDIYWSNSRRPNDLTVDRQPPFES